MNHLEAIVTLIDLHRYADAELLGREVLRREPENAPAHRLLAWAVACQNRMDEAQEEVETAIRLDPNGADGFYTLGFILSGKHLEQAQSALEKAIRLQPEKPAYYALLGRLHLANGKEEAAMEVASRGRTVDPHSIDCANVQVVALMRMGQNKEAYRISQEALAIDPSNAQTHASYGWTMLAQGQPEMARVSFGQALRINPKLENAREGLVEALKTRYPVYGWLLRVSLWSSQRPPVKQSLMITLAFTAWLCVGGQIAMAFPKIALIALCVSYLPLLLIAVAMGSRQVFDLLLRLDPYTRMTLSREQIIASNWVIAGAGSLLLSIPIYYFTRNAAITGLACIGLLLIARIFLGAADPRIRKDEMRPF